MSSIGVFTHSVVREIDAADLAGAERDAFNPQCERCDLLGDAFFDGSWLCQLCRIYAIARLVRFK